MVSNYTFQDLLTNAVKTYILSISILFEDKFKELEKPINTFIGRQWKLVRQNIGVDLYDKLMQACYIENNNLPKL